MKLIKITTDHYVIVDETIQPVQGYYYDAFINKIKNTNGAEYGKASHCWQITHSTKPLESIVTEDSFKNYEYLPIQEVKELIGEVDLEKNMWYERNVQNPYPSDSPSHTGFKKGFELGYNQALEDNKGKKYTEEDLRKMFEMGIGLSSFSDTDDNKFKYALEHIQPKTEWEVEIIDGKLILK